MKTVLILRSEIGCCCWGGCGGGRAHNFGRGDWNSGWWYRRQDGGGTLLGKDRDSRLEAIVEAAVPSIAVVSIVIVKMAVVDIFIRVVRSPDFLTRFEPRRFGGRRLEALEAGAEAGVDTGKVDLHVLPGSGAGVLAEDVGIHGHFARPLSVTPRRKGISNYQMPQSPATFQNRREAISAENRRLAS